MFHGPAGNFRRFEVSYRLAIGRLVRWCGQSLATQPFFTAFPSTDRLIPIHLFTTGLGITGIHTFSMTPT
jgi:hypothetical protein